VSDRAPEAPLDAAFLLSSVRTLHEDIRAASGELLERARREEAPELAARVGAQGAGDVGYAIDEAAEAALEAFGARLGARQPLTLVSEGPGVRRYAPDEDADAAPAPGAPLRAIIDPIDGTRSLMHDMRSAWALTGLARDRGAATRLSDVEVAVQTELPTTLAGAYRVLWAQRGAGAWIARHDARTGRELERRPLRARPETRIENGYLCFTRFLPVERPLVADLEARFLQRIIAAHGLQPRLLYDDQYLCTAGQLHLVTTGRYRMLADLRGWLHRTRGLQNFCSKPYDLATLLVYQEAGVPVLDERFQPLDAPLDTETRLSVIAFANEGLRAQLEPHLRAALEELPRGRAPEP
jgi:fructose-1,6-bisphosphatase/inositol monophosphatase family enzyme